MEEEEPNLSIHDLSLPIIDQPQRMNNSFDSQEINTEPNHSRKRSSIPRNSNNHMELRTRKKSRSEDDSGINPPSFTNESNEDQSDVSDNENGSDSDYESSVHTKKNQINYKNKQYNLPFLNVLKCGSKTLVSPITLRKSLLLLLQTNVAASQIPNIFKVTYF